MTRASADFLCYRCGASLEALTPPFSRSDLCPECSVQLHVCRMCVFFDPGVPAQCREDDAEEVTEKERANFCDWFTPNASAYDPSQAGRVARAESDLAALFGEHDEETSGPDPLLDDAEDLFR